MQRAFARVPTNLTRFSDTLNGCIDERIKVVRGIRIHVPFSLERVTCKSTRY